MNKQVEPRLNQVRRHAGASLWGMAEYFAYPLMMFAATPWFLRLLGSEQYGQWMLLLTFNGLGGLAGLGMGSAAIRDVAAARGRGDPADALAAVRACVSVTLACSLAACALLGAFGLLAGGALLAQMGEPHLIRTIIGVASLLIILEQLDTVFAGTLRGMERFDISARVEALTKGGLVLAALAAAWATHNVLWVFAATVAMTLLRLAVKAWVASKLLGAVPKPSWDRPRMATVFAFGKWTWVQALGAALFSTADRFLVGASLGAEALARYSICLQLAQQVQTIPAAGAQFLFPAISRRREAGEDYRRLAIRASLAIAALGAAMALPLALLPGPILRIWVGPEIAASSAGVLTWLAVAFAILAASVGPFYVLLGSGRERYATLVSLGAGLLAAVVAYLLLARLGLIGAVGGRLTYASLCLLLAVPIFAGAFRRGATPSS